MEVEKYEWSNMYKNFAKTARKEGFVDIAELFELTSTVEKAHEERYKVLADNIENDSVFKKSDEIVWKCNNCGYLHKGKEAPEKCPMCDHPQAHYRKLTEGYK
ncbi:MAG: ferritin family protein [Methanobrevibacter sp.]|nr:ferritin family protein [Methanobrevibacter sp.]